MRRRVAAGGGSRSALLFALLLLAKSGGAPADEARGAAGVAVEATADRQDLLQVPRAASEAAAEAPVEAAQQRSYSPGSRVEMHGLSSAVSLNGMLGTVVSFDAEKGRYEISVDGSLFNKKIKASNLKPGPPDEVLSSPDARSWWAVYDCVAMASTALTLFMTVRCCCGSDGVESEAGDEGGCNLGGSKAQPSILKVEVPSNNNVCKVCKDSPPASALSSYTGVSSGLSSRGSTRTGSSGYSGSSRSSSSRRFPSKPISATAEARRQKRMREGISGLVARRPMVWPEGVDQPQDYINDRDWVNWMTKEEEEAAIVQLKELVAEFRGPKGGPEDLFLSEMTLYRYLRARKGEVEAAASMLEETIAWRRASGVAEARVDCPMCCERPGTHTWRQIGFDRRAMPVIYSCAKQEPAGTKVQPQDSNMHMLYALEEAIKTMEPGVTQWVWALDMSGFGLKHASPQLPLHMNALFSRHYPELLGTALIINAPRIFSALWSWVERFVDPNTVAKVRFVNGSREAIRPVLEELFPDDLSRWLEEEIMLNRKGKLNPQQRTWWEPPPHGCEHDPRASPFMLHCYCDPQAPRNVRTPREETPLHPFLLCCPLRVTLLCTQG